MRGLVGFWLSSCLSLFLAGTASAGLISGPIDLDACGSLDIVGDAMVPPDWYIGGTTQRQCEQLCAKAVRDCRAAVKGVVTCHSRVLRSVDSFLKRNCEIVHEDDPASRRECKQSVAGSSAASLDLLKAERAGGLADCDDWADACAGSCLP